MKKGAECPVSSYLLVLALAFAAVCSLAIDNSTVLAEGTSVFKGKISDVEGQPVEGARVFIYSSSDVKRPADFMSAATDNDGLFRMVLPPGKYWSAARLKKTDGYGPLMSGDKHSGEPTEIEVASGHEVDMDFTVADLGEAREAAKKKTKTREGPVRISGRVIDENGSPVRGSYAFANRNQKISGIPHYISAWVDHEGRYTLYVPRGRYYIGGATTFPPGQHDVISQEITVDGDKSDVNIARDSQLAR